MAKSQSLKKYPDFVKFQLPAFLWMAVIFILSSIPGSTLAQIEFPYAHLIAHTLLYAALYYLCYRATEYQRYSKFVSDFGLWISLLFVVVYGAGDEYHQSFVPGRTEQLKDLMIDIIAALVTMIVLALIERLRSGRDQSRSDSRASIDDGR